MAQFHFMPTSAVNSVQSQVEFNLLSAIGPGFDRFDLRSGLDPISYAKWMTFAISGTDSAGSGLSSQGRVTGTAISDLSANQIGVVSPTSIVVGHNVQPTDILEVQYDAVGERVRQL